MLDDRTSRHGQLETAEIEEAPEILELWKGYTLDKFGDLTGMTALPIRLPGTYGRWKRDVERRAACPMSLAKELLVKELRAKEKIR